MKKVLFFPEKAPKDVKNKLKILAKSKDYHLCFYIKDTAIRKFIYFSRYKLKRIVGVGSEQEYRFFDLKMNKCGFDREILNSLILEESELKSEKCLEKISKVL